MSQFSKRVREAQQDFQQALREEAARIETETERIIADEQDGAMRRSMRASREEVARRARTQHPAVLPDAARIEPVDEDYGPSTAAIESAYRARRDATGGDDDDPDDGPVPTSSAAWRDERLTYEGWRPVPRWPDGTPKASGDYEADRSHDPERDDDDVIWEPMNAWDERAWRQTVHEFDVIWSWLERGAAFCWRILPGTAWRFAGSFLIYLLILGWIGSEPTAAGTAVVFASAVLGAVMAERHRRPPRPGLRSYHGPGPVPGTVGDPLDRELKMYGEPEPEPEPKASLPDEPWFGEPTRGYRTGGCGALAHAAMREWEACLTYHSVPPLIVDPALIQRNRR